VHLELIEMVAAQPDADHAGRLADHGVHPDPMASDAEQGKEHPPGENGRSSAEIEHGPDDLLDRPADEVRPGVDLMSERQEHRDVGAGVDPVPPLVGQMSSGRTCTGQAGHEQQGGTDQSSEDIALGKGDRPELGPDAVAVLQCAAGQDQDDMGERQSEHAPAQGAVPTDQLVLSDCSLEPRNPGQQEDLDTDQHSCDHPGQLGRGRRRGAGRAEHRRRGSQPPQEDGTEAAGSQDEPYRSRCQRQWPPASPRDCLFRSHPVRIGQPS